eukprot:TRINITY_DN75091_c0_g1_i1.p2 TRINITY_DN75091_c0_g1~~TRINITY_DN75091_c0_g1_i1.p2  ORF type:complete len:218 (-),score=14.21 TRINITY_DN75091_c0_g1_i1:31-633(-)
MFSYPPTGINSCNGQQSYYLLLQIIDNNIESLDARGIANCLWGLAKGVVQLKIHEYCRNFHKVYFLLCEQAVLKCEQMNGQEISNSLWAMGKIENKQVNIQFLAILKIVMQYQFDQFIFENQHVANILWAMGKLGIEDIPSIIFFINLAHELFDNLTRQNVSNIVWALRELRFYDEYLFQSYSNTQKWTNPALNQNCLHK